MAEYKECESCPGYCCITNSPTYTTPLTNDDINKIAAYLKIPLDRFMREFVVLTRGQKIYDGAPDAIAHLKTLGSCPFLRSGLCGINDVKPLACVEAKPVQFGNVTCEMWYKQLAGLPQQEVKIIVTHAPTATACVSMGGKE